MRHVFVLLVFLLMACGGTADQLTPADVLAAFQEAGLEAENPDEWDSPADWGLLPHGEAGIHFLIPSLCEDCGGRILLLEDGEQADRVEEYYEELGNASAAFASWVFRRGDLIVQINGDLPEQQAREYEAALNAIE